ncbi:hypothetical protein PRK78_003643 [Emydomyces testavorans]|uniref:Potassium transporter n=1 Tax=Emydomyces testavorans TaxID=2070801 RepID=A0AAF0DJK3_9EURO|nr:hypothetical protein PRK78_003643 [Emydomyces testavorans]
MADGYVPVDDEEAEEDEGDITRHGERHSAEDTLHLPARSAVIFDQELDGISLNQRVVSADSLHEDHSKQLLYLLGSNVEFMGTRSSMAGLRCAYQSIGAIYGDIGTSPLYVFSAVFTTPPEPNDLLGALSLIIWALILIATVKYVGIVLCANDHGEGGSFALLSLIRRHIKLDWRDSISEYGEEQVYREEPLQRFNSSVKNVLKESPMAKRLVIVLAVLGVCMVISDGVITPAQSILGAVQVLFDHNVITAFSPRFAIDYMIRHKFNGWRSLGGVLLAFTGVEALFADLGAFSVKQVLPGRWGDNGYWSVQNYYAYRKSLTKIPAGGWFTVIMAATLTSTLLIWSYGEGCQFKAERDEGASRSTVFTSHDRQLWLRDGKSEYSVKTIRAGIGVFLIEPHSSSPPVVDHFIKKFEAIHELSVLLHIKPIVRYSVPTKDRFSLTTTNITGLYHVTLRYGYGDTPSWDSFEELLTDELGLLHANEEPDDHDSTMASNADPDSIPLTAAGHSASQKPITYIIGRDKLYIKKGSSFIRRVFLAVFIYLKGHEKTKLSRLKVPVDRLVEVGFSKAI